MATEDSRLPRTRDRSDETLGAVGAKAAFWEKANELELNERQRRVLNRLTDGFEGKLTSSKWAKIAKCSQDTAARDIDDLVRKGLLKQRPAGGRSTSYKIVDGI